eukprot:10156866-Alexandrium_andersonii.AAC.1
MELNTSPDPSTAAFGGGSSEDGAGAAAVAPVPVAQGPFGPWDADASSSAGSEHVSRATSM